MPTDPYSRLPGELPQRPEVSPSAQPPAPDMRFRHFVETPGRMSSIAGLAVGLVLALFFGLLIGKAEMSTIMVLSGGLVFSALVIGLGEYWWGLLVVVAALALTSSRFGFRMTGFEMGFAAVVVVYLVRCALRATRKFRPTVGVDLPFSALFFFLLVHCALLVTYSRYESPDTLKNILRGYYSALAPLAFFGLLGWHCHPGSVKRVTVILIAITTFTTLVAIPVFLFGVQFPILQDLPIGVQWLDPELVGANLRNAPLLATFAIALWPTMTTAPRRWMMQGLVGLSLVAGAASSGRIAFAGVFLVILLFCLLNRKWLFLIIAGVGLALLTVGINVRPEVLDEVPETAARALSPLHLNRSHLHDATELSDKWHSELRADSIDYWTESYPVFFFGHGFGGWDYRLSGDEQWTRDFEYAKKMAIRMGKTENAFSAVTNVFGLVGLLLYLWFIFSVAQQLWTAHKATPPRSFPRAMCQVSLISLAMFVLLAPFAGGIPAWDIFYWQLGLLAARPYLKGASEPVPEPIAMRPPIQPQRRRREAVGAARFAPVRPRMP